MSSSNPIAILLNIFLHCVLYRDEIQKESDETASPTIHLLFPNEFAGQNGEQESLIAQISLVIENVEKIQKSPEVKDLAGQATVVFEVKGAPTLTLKTQPALAAETEKKFVKILGEGLDCNPAIFAMGFTINFEVGKPDPKSPPFLPPPLRSKGDFKSLPQKANS